MALARRVSVWTLDRNTATAVSAEGSIPLEAHPPTCPRVAGDVANSCVQIVAVSASVNIISLACETFRHKELAMAGFDRYGGSQFEGLDEVDERGEHGEDEV